jgi:death-on-curing protein
MSFTWLQKTAVLQFHDAVIAQDGGSYGVRDEGLLESALARPQNLFSYEGKDVFECAAAYAYGIAKNHPFVDGNKRSAFMSCYTFLQINGQDLDAPETEVVMMMVALASSEIDEPTFAAWLKKNSAKIG